MKTLVVTSDNNNELKVLKYLAKKMGMETKVLSENEKRRYVPVKGYAGGKKNDYVTEKEVIKALRAK